MAKQAHPMDAARDADLKIIGQIADRAVMLYAKNGVRVERLDVWMNVTAVHFRVQPLRLSDLLATDDGNFAHDIGGINRHLDRENYRLNDHFSPRFSGREVEASHTMSETKFTKGPWFLAELCQRGMFPNDGGFAIMAPDADQGNRRVALVDCQTPFKRGKGNEAKCEERDANARLIAASPTMLDALEKAEQQLDYGQVDAALKIIRAALSSAQGKGQ